MKGNVVDIYKAFDGSDKKLVIPVYQRNYDWTPKQCERLFNDIEDMIATRRQKHFFGAVVGNPEDSFTWVVIDGQQRMTTVSLLMLALVHAIEAGEVKDPSGDLGRKLMTNYLQLTGTGSEKFKLKPIKDDSSSYAKLFGPEEFFNEKSKLTANYRYFRDRLRETNYDADQIWGSGISRLEVMHLDLESHDDPQRIFESLNSTGLALKEADKIRNFVLMGLPHVEQTRVYEKYWNEMEKNVDFRTDNFIRWYLTAQTSKTPKEADVFEAFKDYVHKSPNSAVDVVEDMHRFSTFAKALSQANTNYPDVDRRLRTSNMVFGDVVKPFLWLTYRDLIEGDIDAHDFASVLGIIESYVFRRVVVSVASNSLNKIFANGHSELRKMRRSGERYSDILAYMFLHRSHSGRFPDDAEFLDEVRVRDFYRLQASYKPYLFQMLERGSSKDVVDIAASISQGDLTIEHIMPQTLSNAWREELGPDAEKIHSTWVNRLANLTITGYNAQYSNSSFSKKLEMKNGFKDSPYSLNDYIKRQSEWGLHQLEERSEALAQRALELWPLPDTTFEPVREVFEQVPLGEEQSFTGREVVAVELEGAKTAVKTWVDAVEIVLSTFLDLDRDGVLSVAEDDSLLLTPFTSPTASTGKYRKIDPALGVHVKNSTAQKISLLRRVCASIGYDPDDILFYLRSTSGDADAPPSDVAAEEVDPGPYNALLALIPHIEQIEGSSVEASETRDQRESLRKALSPHLPADPLSVLGGRNLESFLAQRSMDSLSTEECLACLAMYNQQAMFMGDTVWHAPLVDGRVGALLRQIQANA